MPSVAGNTSSSSDCIARSVTDCYAIDQSPFYRLTSKRKLGELLGVSPSTLQSLATPRSHFETVMKCTPNSWPNSTCERPKSFLILRMLAAFMSQRITYLLIFCLVIASHVSRRESRIRGIVSISSCLLQKLARTFGRKWRGNSQFCLL